MYTEKSISSHEDTIWLWIWVKKKNLLYSDRRIWANFENVNEEVLKSRVFAYLQNYYDEIHLLLRKRKKMETSR